MLLCQPFLVFLEIVVFLGCVCKRLEPRWVNVCVCEKESVGEYRGKIDGAEAVHLD